MSYVGCLLFDTRVNIFVRKMTFIVSVEPN